jgi:hypothetical protein
MKKVVVRLFILMVPILIPTILVSIGSFYIGEGIPVSLVVEMQRNAVSPIIYYPTGSRQEIMYYKYIATVSRRPEILILGSSRMFQFRSEFFNEQSGKVYNAAIPSLDINEMQRFLTALNENGSMPHILILNIDVPYFNAAETELSDNRLSEITPPLSYEYNYVKQKVRSTAKEWFMNPPNISLLLQNSRRDGIVFLGIGAITTDYGFRNDGSLYFGSVESSIAQRLDLDWQRFTNAREWFEQGSELNEDALSDIEQILQLAKANDTLVIGILSPYRKQFFTRMMESGNYTYFNKARDKLTHIFNQFNMYIFDFTDPYLLDGRDEELYDSWHPGELLTLRMLAQIVKSLPQSFEPYIEVKALHRLIDTTESSFFVIKDVHG